MEIEWGKAFQVFYIGFGGVFCGLVLLKICVNVIAIVVRIVERFSLVKK